MNDYSQSDRLGLLDVLLWNVPPQILVGDALWFSVIAVMCRVHSLVLWILVSFEVASLMLALGGGFVDIFAFDHVRYGMYSVVMLIIMAGAYFLDEQTRLQSYGQVMSLQDQNAALAEMMLRWKAMQVTCLRNLCTRMYNIISTYNINIVIIQSSDYIYVLRKGSLSQVLPDLEQNSNSEQGSVSVESSSSALPRVGQPGQRWSHISFGGVNIL